MELLNQFENKIPEITFYWKDQETEAEGWLVINSLKGGAAGGGTRMRKGLKREEVVSLAKTMEIKFSVSGPPIGGAKSGINFDPKDKRKKGVLKRWFKVVAPLLKQYYGTGGDLNVDEVKEVIAITEEYNVWHPQEGVLTGHFNPIEIDKINRISRLREGVSKIVKTLPYTPLIGSNMVVADLITGYGVAESVKHFYSIYKKVNCKDKRVIIQGWGNVAATAAYYLANQGAKIVGIIDKEGGIINKEGFSFDQIRQLFLDKKGNKLYTKQLLPFEEVNEIIWQTGAHIFIPAAASRLVTKEQLEVMIDYGLEVISCGANVPFKEPEIFYGLTSAFADKQVSLIPDFIANCGMARAFNFFMQTNSTLNDEAIFNDTSDCIKQAIEKCFNINSNLKFFAKTAFEIALGNIKK